MKAGVAASSDIEHEARARRQMIFELSVLTMLVLAIAYVVIPTHTNSIWMDWEFTGWTAPLVNRIAEGQVLNADGLHQPLPPLPYVFLFWATQGHATWLSESVAIWICQSATLFVMYFTLRKAFRGSMPFAGVFLSIPIYFRLQKTILYDSSAHLSVSILAWAVANWSIASAEDDRKRARSWTVALGAVAATALLVKQSSGTTATVATLLALVLFARDRREAGRQIAIFVGSYAVTFASWCAAVSPWVSIPGMLRDAFVVGAIPKGGTAAILLNLVRYTADALFPALPIAVLVRFSPIARNLLATKVAWAPENRVTKAALFAGFVVTCAAYVVIGHAVDGHVGFLHTALAISVTISLLAVLRVNLNCVEVNLRAYAPMLLVLLAGALGHSTSVVLFRWIYDASALVPLAFCVLFATLSGLLRTARLQRVAWPVLVTALSVTTWLTFAERLSYARQCDTAWPEIAFLKGARLRSSAGGMRELVHAVRQLTRESETVLLLPSDPNVEAWFERPRPHLSTSVVFTDQYWDEDIEVDISRLEQAPPKVIVIGPRNYWRFFNKRWHLAAMRFIDRVQQGLLASRYRLVRQQPITFRDERDYMDVYVRTDLPMAGLGP